MQELVIIKEYVQMIAETITSVVGVDVTIVDINSIRVAATGKYKDKIGYKIVDKSVFARAMKENKSFIVNSPGNEEVCRECEGRNRCIEYAEVCSPITLNSVVIGAIGLVALSENQRDALKSNIFNLLEFLKKMGDLLATKLLEVENDEKQRIILKQIETIIDSIDDGIIAIDEKRKVIYINKIADNMFGKSKWESKEEIKKITETQYIDKVLYQGESIKNIQINSNKVRLVLSAKPIKLENRIIGCVLVLRTLKDVNRIINDISGSIIDTEFKEIIGESREFIAVKENAKTIAEGDSTVLIFGESGTGKEMFARAIHSYGERKNRPFIAINCAAIPESLLESELFGYDDGAFTGARKGGKLGKFEIANGGTIFLDEIGDMPLHLQTKLLRVLQERSIEKIGALSPIPIDIRVVAATHKNLDAMVENGEFREDLYYRLNVIPIKIPPLRIRKRDVIILTDYILTKCNSKLKKNIKGVDKEVHNILESYPWPGNVRELENVIEYAVNMESTEFIQVSSLPLRLKEVKHDYRGYNLKDIEKSTIEQVLKIYKNRDDAAKILGIGRATLFRKIKEYKINVSE
jgi:sigma-54 dependent transcriptional regulator, acetoin dehydrogenase operon transcriptional activator AcoR